MPGNEGQTRLILLVQVKGLVESPYFQAIVASVFQPPLWRLPAQPAKSPHPVEEVEYRPKLLQSRRRFDYRQDSRPENKNEAVERSKEQHDHEPSLKLEPRSTQFYAGRQF